MQILKNTQWKEKESGKRGDGMDDRCYISPYVDGLCSLIRDCDMPFSIAVQEDWECGKTSMMNMLKDKLEKEGEIRTVWFDIGQYSQFHTEAVELKRSLQELIAGNMKEEDDRILFFIDHLNVLEPAVVLELLEALKILSDHRKCGFILAMNKEFVFTEIWSKHKGSADSSTVENYFDRLIQFTFQFPVSLYKTEGMLEKSLQVEIHSCSDRKWYLEAVYLLTNGNPYSIESLSNAFLLADKVADSKGIYRVEHKEMIRRKKIMFLLSGIQLVEPKMYRHLVVNASYGFFLSLFRVSSDDREEVTRKMTQLKFAYHMGTRDHCVDIMCFFASTLQEYVEDGLDFCVYPHMRINDFCQIVNMNMEADWMQPESSDNCNINKEGEMSEITDPHEMYLYDRMDLVLCSHFKKVKEWETIGYDYRYCPKKKLIDIDEMFVISSQEMKYLEIDWFFGIKFLENEIFPTVYLNSALLEEERPWHGEILRMQRNLSFFYGKLQDVYGKKAFGDMDFTGTEFLVYSKQQAETLIHDLVEIFNDKFYDVWLEG